MIERHDESGMATLLSAFADGELDAEQKLAVLQHLESHPESIMILADLQKLRIATRRVMEANTPPMPNRIREAVETAATQNKKVHRFQMHWPLRMAIAAVLLLAGSIAGFIFASHSGSKPTVFAVESNLPIAPVMVAAVTKVHVDCSRFAPQLHSGPFPTTAPFNTVEKDVEAEFHRTVPYPDLTSVGYSFVGAGPCRKPLENTVHLLYRSIKLTVHDTLSIFVQPFNGQVRLQPGVMKVIAGADAPHPMIVWRSDREVYYLVADEFTEAEQARDSIQVAMSR